MLMPGQTIGPLYVKTTCTKSMYVDNNLMKVKCYSHPHIHMYEQAHTHTQIRTHAHRYVYTHIHTRNI